MHPPDDESCADESCDRDLCPEDVIADARTMLASAMAMVRVIALAAERFGALDRAAVRRLAGQAQSELADADALLEGFISLILRKQGVVQ